MPVTALATLATVATTSTTSKPQPAVVLRSSPSLPPASPPAKMMAVRATAVEATPATVIAKAISVSPREESPDGRDSPVSAGRTSPIAATVTAAMHTHYTTVKHQAKQVVYRPSQSHSHSHGHGHSVPMTVHHSQHPSHSSPQSHYVPMYYTQVPMPVSVPVGYSQGHPSHTTMMMVPASSMPSHHTATMMPTMVQMPVQSHMSMAPHTQYAYVTSPSHPHAQGQTVMRTVASTQPTTVQYVSAQPTMMYHPTGMASHTPTFLVQ